MVYFIYPAVLYETLQPAYPYKSASPSCPVELSSHFIASYNKSQYSPSLCEVNQDPYYYDLGYRFTQKYWGKGYATEASAALMDYAFNKLKIPCVYALIEADNLKSRRVLEKVGFHEDKPMTIDGVPHVQFKAIKPM